MRISKKTLASSIGSALGLMVLSMAPAMAASSFGDHLWQFVSGDGTTTANVIDFNKGLSRIFDDVNLTLSTDDTIYLNAPGVVWVNNALSANNVAARGGATVGDNLSVGGDISGDSVTLGSATAASGAFTTDVTRATGATGSYQPVAGDLTYEGAAGGTDFWHAGVMGHFHGDDLTNTTSAIHAGIIGAYSVTTGDDLTGPRAGVVGTIGHDGASTTGDGAFVAALGGDSGVNIANAAYGVQYMNSTAGSHFNYGLDLYHAATADYGAPSAVEYGIADIRLQSGAKISNETSNLVEFSGATSLRIPAAGINLTDGGDACGLIGSITYDTGGAFFGCDGALWQELTN